MSYSQRGAVEDVEFQDAVLERVWLVIGLAGASGSGKTMSAFRMAQGIVGRDQKFAVIDTEARRALHYAPRPGAAPDFQQTFNFAHREMGPPFRPDAYAQAIESAARKGYRCIVVDSFSHEHAGEGGLLDWHEAILSERVARAMATRKDAKEWELRDGYNQLAWIEPKMAHKRMVQRLLQVHCHLILCLRAEDKVEMAKDPETRKTVFRPKETLSGYKGWIPICEKTLPFELTASFVLTPERPGLLVPIKLQEQHKAIFPLDEQVGESSGRRIAEWASGGAEPQVTPAARPATAARGGGKVEMSTADKVAAAREALGYPDEQFDRIVAGKLGGPLAGAPEEEIERALLPYLRRLARKEPAALDELAGLLAGQPA